MKKKFNLIIFFLIFFPLSTQGGVSPKCLETFKNIKTSKNPDLQYFQKVVNSTYGFDPLWVMAKDDKNNLKLDEDGEPYWILKRDINNYPLVGRFLTSKLINELMYGDTIISVNGTHLNELKDVEIYDLLVITEDNENINSEIIFERNGKKFKLKLELLTNLIQDDKVRFVIKNISDISQVKSTFKADIYMDVEHDYDYDTENLPLGKILFNGLVYKNLENEWDYQWCKIPEDLIIKNNIPDPRASINFLNSVNLNKNAQNIEMEIYPYSAKIGDDVEYDYTRIVSILDGSFEFRNVYDLKTFPFDKQKLVFKIFQGNNLNKYVIDYKSHTVRALERYIATGSINGWDIKKYDIKNVVYEDEVGDPLSGIEISLEIERKTGYYVYKVILPILLILLVCWSVVWIAPRELESKLTITIVCLLSLIAYNFVIDKELPKLEYLTVLDWIILVSYV